MSFNTPSTVDNTYSGQALVQVFLCENPWSYEDPVTHYELLYCRDADPLLPELSKPSE
ncbi:unnamed protein product [marine sediment metagenome]|uniref:Uncharacterized protein n=1 Tax=marine sediment metagenome TaxID=412755 RepID=X1PKN3_9ZZZZ